MVMHPYADDWQHEATMSPHLPHELATLLASSWSSLVGPVITNQNCRSDKNGMADLDKWEWEEGENQDANVKFCFNPSTNTQKNDSKRR